MDENEKPCVSNNCVSAKLNYTSSGGAIDFVDKTDLGEVRTTITLPEKCVVLLDFGIDGYRLRFVQSTATTDVIQACVRFNWHEGAACFGSEPKGDQIRFRTSFSAVELTIPVGGKLAWWCYPLDKSDDACDENEWRSTVERGWHEIGLRIKL